MAARSPKQKAPVERPAPKAKRQGRPGYHKTTVELPQELYAWLKAKVDEGEFGHISHGIAKCVRDAKARDGKSREPPVDRAE